MSTHAPPQILGVPITLPARPGPVAVIAPRTDRGVWGGLSDDITGALSARGRACAATPAPPLLARDLCAFTRDGDRAGFEAKYFARRRRLNGLAMAALAEGTPCWGPDLADAAWQICEETGWQLPAHNAHIRGGVRAPLPDPDRPVVDLFAAETAAQLAVLAASAGDLLEACAPTITARITREVDIRVLTPYLTEKIWWMGGVDGPTNNWTVWCTQNVMLAALCLPIDSARRHTVLVRAIASLDTFLREYPDDGACDEGAMYYRHAGLCLWGALHLLEQIAPQDVAHVWCHPKIRNIAAYIEAVHIADQTYVNFADCPALNPRCTLREVLFAQATRNDRLRDFACRDAGADGWDDLPDEINLWYRALQALHGSMLEAPLPPAPSKRDAWYPSVGLLVARDDVFTLAVKAGHNDDSHNHNDTGSVILYRGARPVLIDVGVGTYTARTFSPDRYQIWTMQSAWHNLPSFGGVMQQAGREFAARDVRVTRDHQIAAIEMELADAWPKAAQLHGYHRRVALEKNRRVVIEDRYDCDLPAELSLMFAEPPQITSHGLVLPRLATITIEGAGEIRLDHRPCVGDARLEHSWPEGVWRAAIAVRGTRLRLTIN